jgi:uncharacterized protein with PIN domain
MADMIVVDSSAVIAIFRQHEDAGDHARRIAADDEPVMSADNLGGDLDCAAWVEKNCAGGRPVFRTVSDGLALRPRLRAH